MRACAAPRPFALRDRAAATVTNVACASVLLALRAMAVAAAHDPTGYGGMANGLGGKAVVRVA